jgi:protein tyrosine/serine phosphatase
MTRAMTALITLVTGALLTSCNFHEIDPGKVYRSAQLDEEQLIEAITKVGIKTVINLRGFNPNDDWYKTEKSVTTRFGVEQIDIPMSAGRLPHRRDLLRLLEAFEKAERPILVHCKAGADRTGEAMAIYQMLYMGKSKDEALEMLTTQYNHYSAFKPAKRYFIEEVWQGADWARTEYNPCVTQYKYYDQNDPACTGGRIMTATSEDDDT